MAPVELESKKSHDLPSACQRVRNYGAVIWTECKDHLWGVGGGWEANAVSPRWSLKSGELGAARSEGIRRGMTHPRRERFHVSFILFVLFESSTDRLMAAHNGEEDLYLLLIEMPVLSVNTPDTPVMSYQLSGHPLILAS